MNRYLGYEVDIILTETLEVKLNRIALYLNRYNNYIRDSLESFKSIP